MSHIWVPRTKIIEPDREIISPLRVGGRFKFTAIRPDGRERPLTDWFSNLVLNQGLDTVASSAAWMNVCRVGTGNTAPAVTDTNLVASIAANASIQSDTAGVLATTPYYAWRIRTFRFAQGAAAGNLAEVGVGTSTANGNNLFSRELIRDGGGSPTTITVLSDEFLDVTYEHRIYPADLSDVVGSVTIAAVMYTTTGRAAGCGTGGTWGVPYNMQSISASSLTTAYNGTLGPVTGGPSGSSGGSSSDTNATYVNGNYYRDYTSNWSLNNGNLSGGITAVRFNFGDFFDGVGCGSAQIGFSPAIPKDNTKTLALTVRRSWTRHSLP